jgi:transcriptional regulator with XRE-family HTH domain
MPRIARRRPRTKIAARRQHLKLTQRELSQLTGISERTIQRLERGEFDNPPIRYLANLARVFECDLTDICEDDWLEWTVFDANAPEPPPKEHWLRRG